jgi:type IV pilus assembly protein PilF
MRTILLIRPAGLLLISLSLSLVLTGCITTTTGAGSMPPPSLDEASELNLQLGIGYLRRGDLQGAQLKLEKAVEQNPDLVMAHIMLGLVYERLGDDDIAEISYRRAVAIGPRDPDALNSLGVFLCHEDSGRLEALKLFNRALDVPQSEAFSNRAMLNTNAGICAKPEDLQQAEKYLRTALSLDPKFSVALIQLADVAYQRENYLQSRAFLERYMSQDKVSPTALWLAVRVESAMDDVTAANEYGRRLKEDFPASVEARLLMEQERDAGI